MSTGPLELRITPRDLLKAGDHLRGLVPRDVATRLFVRQKLMDAGFPLMASFALTDEDAYRVSCGTIEWRHYQHEDTVMFTWRDEP